MTAIALFAAATLLGVNVGWQPTPDGGVEYIIQIPPQAIESFVPGRRSKATSRRRCSARCNLRIIVGNKTLPRTLPAHPAGEPKAMPAEKGPAGEQKAPAEKGPAVDQKEPEPEKRPAVEQKEPEIGVTAAAPAPLPSNPASKPLTGQAAVFNEPAPAEARPVVAGSGMPAAKPWLPLWLTAVALFASLGANVYLGWIAVDVRRRWRTLVEKAA